MRITKSRFIYGQNLPPPGALRPDLPRSAEGSLKCSLSPRVHAKMPLPSRDKTFALESCRDLLNKLEREIERLREATAREDVAGMADIAFNASVTAWHLCDWVFGDMTQEQRDRLNVQTLSDLRQTAVSNRALHLCRQIATASKHWEISQHPDLRVGAAVSATPERRIHFIDGDKRIDALDVFEEAFDFWTRFIYPNNIQPKIDDEDQ
jgi:hypothetical protein